LKNPFFPANRLYAEKMDSPPGRSSESADIPKAAKERL
jgi:hypothetical protein